MPAIPESLLCRLGKDGFAIPLYLGEQDHPWLRTLIDEYDRFVGQPRRALDERLREPLVCPCPDGKRRIAQHVLDRAFGARCEAALSPPKARAAVFEAAAAAGGAPEAILSSVARDQGVSVAELQGALFADLPGERRVASAGQPISPSAIALRANLSLVQALLSRSANVSIELLGNARAVVRYAKLRGLICTILPRGAGGQSALLELSGPFAIFRRTLLYGRALADLVPQLAWCDRFRLRAECFIRNGTRTLVVASGDPFLPAPEPRRYDSRIEDRFARDFRRIALDWDIVREPEPIHAAGALVFPDFALRHRTVPSRRFLLEIAGFWTPDYIARKLARLRDARLPNLILCIDADRNCAAADLPPDTPVIRFRRRIDAAAVLQLIDGHRSSVPE